MTLPASSPGAIAVQYQDADGVWRTFGAAADLGTLLRTRRFGPGPRQGVTAQAWRVVKIGDADLTGATVKLDAIAFWRETAALSPVRLYAFDFDVDTQRYVLAATPGNIEVYRARQRVASIRTPYTDEQLRAVTKVQELDTFLAFHVDVKPLRITRQGSHTQWDSRSATFVTIPVYDYDGTRAGGVNEVQQLTFDSYANGDTFNISLEDFTSNTLVYSNVPLTMIATLTAGLEDMPNVGAGGVAVTALGADRFRVEFIAQNRAQDVAEMAPRSIVTTSGGVFAATLTQGVEGGEAVISDTRGWPACGAFYQQRLYLGGLRSRPSTLLGSRIGDFFNFDTKGRPTAAAIDVTLDTDEATVIRAIYPGRHLQVFTSSAEFFAPTEPIVAPPSIKQTTRRGVQPGTPQAFMDSATVFVTRGGDGLCQFQYSQEQNSYSADWMNLLAAPLVKGVVDMAFRRARSPKEADLALLTRDDGMIAAMMALVSQNVVGFSRWTTDGTYLAACADLAGDFHVAVQRATATGPEIFLEAVDATAWLDSEVKALAPSTPIEEIVGLGHLEGRTVAVMIDGIDGGDEIVAGGRVPLKWPALREAVAGCLFVPRMITLPLAMETDPRPGGERQMRTGQIAVRFGPSANLNAGIAGGKLWPFPMRRRPALADDAAALAPFTGWDRISDIPGFSEEEAVELAQLRPGPLDIRVLAVTVDT